MYPLPPLQHFDELLDFSRAGFGFLDGLNTEKNCVAVGAIELLKKFAGARVRPQGGLKIVRNCGSAGRIVCRFPAAMGFGELDGFQSGGAHATALD